MYLRLLFLALLLPVIGFSQDSSDVEGAREYRPGRAYLLGSSIGLSYTGVMVVLNEAWYADYPRSSFHFFNDNPGWMQVDKVGHFYTSYFIGRMGIDVVRWTGTTENKAIWYGGTIGFTFLLTIETLDGFSEQWGASPVDLLSNGLGTALAIGQEVAWQEQRIKAKFSWSPTNYTSETQDRASALYGTAWQERLIKDYNSQTYWLSGNVNSFFPEIQWMPKWLDVSVGYGAQGILGAESNLVRDGSGTITQDYSSIKRYRQYYLTFDVDFARFKSPDRSKFANSLLEVLNMFKFPAPALEYNSLGKFRFHPVKF